MAIDTITPAANNVLDPGDTFLFRVDNTYTSLTIEVETLTGWEYAYDTALGGAQSGYTVVVAVVGARHEFTVVRTAGFNLNPFQIRVIENETGTSATTTTSYYLSSQVSFPQGADPYYGNYQGNLLVTNGGAVVRSDVKWINLTGAGYTITDNGNGKVTINLSGGGVTDHGALTGLADDDHTQYIAHADIAESEGFLRKTASETYVAIKTNMAAAVAPTINEDSGDGYAIGSRWLDTTADREHVCFDATVGAAVWKCTSVPILGFPLLFTPTTTGTTDWYGPNQSTASATYPASQSFNVSWGAGPTMNSYTLVPIVPFACKLVRLETWIRSNSSLTTQYIAFYKIAYSSDSSGATITQVWLTTDDATGRATGSSYNISANITSSNDFAAGDGYIMLVKNITNAAPCFIRCQPVFEIRS